MKRDSSPGLEWMNAIHQVVVARYNDHQIVPVVLHGLEDGVDGLLTEVVLARYR